MLHIKPQLDCRRDLIDILPAWAGGANEFFFDLVLGDGEIVCNDQHALSLLMFQSKLKSIISCCAHNALGFTSHH
jgi:hypothetical protein